MGEYNTYFCDLCDYKSSNKLDATYSSVQLTFKAHRPEWRKYNICVNCFYGLEWLIEGETFTDKTVEGRCLEMADIIRKDRKKVNN